MRTLAVALVVLVVGAGVTAALPAAANSDRAPRDADSETRDALAVRADGPVEGDSSANETLAVEAREPPTLPERWQRTYGGSGDDIFADAVRTDDGGYLLVGWTGGENRDGWVLKTDGEGNKQWAETLGGSGTDRLWGVARTDSGYLLAGRTDDDGANGWVVEMSADGETLENRTLGSGAFYAVERRDAGDATGYLLAGWTDGDGSTAGWTVGLDANRSTAWQESHAVPEGYDAGYIRAIVPTDTGYYLAGKIEGDSDDAWALRLAADGTREWQTTAGGPSRDDVWAAASAASPGPNASDADAGFVLAGETESNSTGPRDGWLVKFGPDGTVEWEHRPGGEGTQWLDSAMRTDEGFLFTGGSDAGPKGSVDGYLLATDAAGESERQTYYGTDGWDKPWPAIRAHGGGYLLAGQTSGNGATARDGWLLRIGGQSANGTGTTGEATTDGGGTTDEAMRGDTATATATSEGPIPGFGLDAALVALAGLLLVAQQWESR
ncbi:hypothetical protein [Halorussus sp. MSC15.2]|uniref:hypothetical protein n=1 Tax=Halorussus sp. MSC15.2 TaxID=2283638 RepID=UPI0013D7DE36|nr:hypothetical protein [Halorussus sp. MSC15.2]NEU58325.1 hypothetical protein [Halorussus sp. MSC15.2]